MTERLVVIGGDAGGMSAASQARRLRSADELEIIAFERGSYTSYSACGIPYFIGDVVPKVESLIARSPETFKDEYQIDARIRHEVTEVDLTSRRLRVSNLESSTESWEAFDHLVIATGAQPLRPSLEGCDAEGIFGVQVLGDGIAIRDYLKARKSKHAVVIGGGYIGLEMAEAFSLQGLEVALVEQASQPMPTVDPDLGKLITDAMSNMGVEMHLGETVTGFESKDGHVQGVVTDSGSLHADIVVLGLGARPNVELAKEAGIDIGDSGAIKVDSQMQTNAERVWSAGDCAEKFHRISRGPIALALGTHANKEGRVAGINIGGGFETFPGVVGTAVSKVCSLEVARTGLSSSEAKASGFECLSVVIDSTTRAGYYPGASPIKTKLIAEVGTGRLIGAQIIGEEGAAKRIDVLATALWNEMTVDEILNMDLSYAPPFSPVWDPVLIAARKAWSAVQAARSEEPS